MEILRACHSLFLKAPMIEELAAEGSLRGFKAPMVGELAAKGGLRGLRLPWEGSWPPKAV